MREDIESLDYDIDSSSIFEQDLQQQSAQYRRCQNGQRWLVCAAIGCTTGAVAFLIDVITAQILQKKYAIAAAAMQYIPMSNDAGPFFAVMAAYVALSVTFVAIAAALVVFIEPVAGGSGIPEVKTYLQGVKVPRLLRTTTLLCKTVGVLFSVGGGLVVGKEGPMIHAGAIVAAGLSQGSSKTCGWRTMWLRRFRNDHDKRDFVSAGAAAGVAAAFGAPIGGVLFAMEEAASFWSQQLTWRTFFCALCSTFTLNLLLSCDPRFQPDRKLSAPFGQLSHPGLITFGNFPQDDPYSLPELPVFLLIGVAGGLMGALFNRLNVRLTLWRSKHMASRVRRFCEPLGIVMLTAMLACCLPFFMRAIVPCTPVGRGINGTSPVFDNSSTAGRLRLDPDLFCRREDNRTIGCENELQLVMHRLACGSSEERSEGVTLLLASHDEAIKSLFHEPTDGDDASGRANFESRVLTFVVFFCFSFGLGLLTYGCAVPSGLFVPAIMSGAAMGRLVGDVIEQYFPDFIVSSSPGNYALIGAAAMLGGICRMTISITVIVVESTTNVSFLLPISLTIFTAKFIGDLFSEGIYDLHVKLKRFPFLPDQPPPARERLEARHIMSGAVKTVCELEQVGTIVKLLRSSGHHGFPVVARGGGGSSAEPRVLGIILRDQLCTVLKHRQFEQRTAPDPSPHLNMPPRGGPSLASPPLTADNFLRPWFRNLVVDELGLRPEDLELYVNLRPYVNDSATVTLQHTSLRRVSRLFRSMGLRHLLVVENCPKVVGVITRKDIIQGGVDDEAPAAPPTTPVSRRAWGRRVKRALLGTAPGSRSRPRSPYELFGSRVRGWNSLDPGAGAGMPPAAERDASAAPAASAQEDGIEPAAEGSARDTLRSALVAPAGSASGSSTASVGSSAPRPAKGASPPTSPPGSSSSGSSTASLRPHMETEMETSCAIEGQPLEH